MIRQLKSLENLSLTEKIGQLIVVRTTGHIFDHQILYPKWEATQPQLKKWLGELNIGGVILLGGSCAEVCDRTQQLQAWAKTPLLIAADIEEGVGQRFAGATWFPPPMALSAVAEKDYGKGKDYARIMGKITAEEALTTGINWILAPITDVNNNADNPVINVRAFGDNAQIVADLADAFREGCGDYPILTTAKHFPGHGDTSTDSHLDLPLINHSQERLESLELKPFQTLIDSGIDAVMTAHLLVKNLDPINPATLSYGILTELLREKMNFEGLIVTDALIMGGVAKYASAGEIALKALQAGADILLMPENPEIAINSILEAVENGILLESRIDESLKRIYKAKEKLFNSPPPLLSWDNIAQNSGIAPIKEILTQSMRIEVIKPLKPMIEGINLIVVDDLLNCDFLHRQSDAILIPESQGYSSQIFDQRNLKRIEGETPFILQAFIRGNPFRGNAGLNDTQREIYQKLINNPYCQGLIIYGSPYVFDWLSQSLQRNIPRIFTYGQMPQAQTLACHHLFGLSSDYDTDKGNFL